MKRVGRWVDRLLRAPGGWPVHLALAALVLPRLLVGEALFDRDLHMDWYPRALVFAETIRRGFLPLWDLTIGFGQPLLADPGAQVLYPTTWLNVFLAPWTVYTLYALGHLVFAAAGMTLLARGLGLRPGQAVACGAAWMLCGPFVSLLNLWHHFAGAAWMPWVVLAAHRLVRHPTAGRVAVFAVCLGLQVLAGSGDMLLLTAGLTGAWLLAVAPPWPRARRTFLPLALGILLAATLSSAQWMPTVDLASRSARSALPEGRRVQWSVPPAGLARLVIPLDATGQLAYAPAAHVALFDSLRPPFFVSLYLGVVALALAVLGLGQRHLRRLALVLAGVAVLAVLVAMGAHTPVYGLAVRLVPGAEQLRFPTKVTVLAGFAVAVLAGMGLRALHRGPRGLRLAAALALVSAAALIGTATLFGPALPLSLDRGLLLDRSGAAGDATASLVKLLGHGILAGVCGLALLKSRPSLAWPRIVAGSCLVLDLLVADVGLHATVPPGFFGLTPPVLSALDRGGHARTYVYEYQMLAGTSERLLGRATPYSVAQAAPGIDPRPFGALGMRVYPVPPCSGYWGVEGSWDLDTRGLQPLPLVRLNHLLRHVEGTPAHLRLLRLGAVRNVVALHDGPFGDLQPGPMFTSLFGEPIRTFSVPGTLPRAYAVGRGRLAEAGEVDSVLLDPSFDPEREVVLPAAVSPQVSASPSVAGRVRIVELFADRLVLDVDLERPGVVVAVDAWDPGWRASVDGQPARVLQANGVFRAVAVPGGRHAVRMLYRPRSVALGSATSAAGLLVLVTVGVMALRRRRRGR